MSAPVLLGCAAVIVSLGLPVVVAVGALDVKTRVMVAADAAALAAADAAGGWIAAEACELAHEVTAAMGVRVVRCDVDLLTEEAHLEVGADSIFGLMLASARAGPAYVGSHD